MRDLLAFAPYGRQGASTRVRIFDWVDRVQGEVVVFGYAGAERNSARQLLQHPGAAIRAELQIRSMAQQRHNRVLIHRAVSPFGNGNLESKIIRSADFSAYDFDDALHWEDPKGRVRALFGSNMRKCVRCVSGVDRVIVGNDTLADWAGQLARDVVVIPSCVDPSVYHMKQSYELSDPPRLVWIGSVSTERYLLSITSALLETHRRTGARLQVFGAPGGIDLGPLERMVDRVPWQLGVAENSLHRFDVGIAPLTDDLYSRGKCAYKVLQYGAAGLPVVASPIGANWNVTSQLGGRLVGSADEWVDELSALLLAPSSCRAAIGRFARRSVEKSYSFQAWSKRWIEAVGLSGGNYRVNAWDARTGWAKAQRNG